MPALDVTAIGNAIVDVLAHADEAVLAEQGLVKGTMALVDEARAGALYAKMGSALEMSGGSAANTAAGIASLGGRAAFIGKVRDDQLGEVFTHDLRATGVRFETKPATSGPATARCLVLVTPDAQRTLNTFLGACTTLTPEDVDDNLVAASRVVYTEGYLWDAPNAKEAILKAWRTAEKAGCERSLSLSDPFCVERHRAEFLALVDAHVDVLFANEHEIAALYEVERFEDAVAAVRGRCRVAVLTRSAQGSVVVTERETLAVAASPVVKVVDTTGAGDLYAAGFLYGYTNGRGLAESGRIGALCAAEIIGHDGARPAVPLASLL